MIGLPAADGRQRMSWNLLILRDATARQTSSCWAARTLTQKRGPDSRSAFHELDASIDSSSRQLGAAVALPVAECWRVALELVGASDTGQHEESGCEALHGSSIPPKLPVGQGHSGIGTDFPAIACVQSARYAITPSVM